MEEEEQAMPDTSTSEDIHKKPIGQVVDDLMQQSQEALKSGARVTAELNELKQRAEDAMDWRKQLKRHSGLAMGAGIGASFLMFLLLRKY